MCLVLFALAAHRRWPLIIAANRDEFYERPSAPAAFWPEAPELLAGRDLRGRGAWCGLNRGGDVAFLTNQRRPEAAAPPGAPSRGELVTGVLQGRVELSALASSADRYAGFNLVHARPERLGGGWRWGAAWLRNGPASGLDEVEPGVHGLSNGALDEPWPKVERGKAALIAALAGTEGAEALSGALFEVLRDERAAPDTELPDTGVGLALERLLAPVFIRAPGYGSRASTVVLGGADGTLRFEERGFGPEGAPQGAARFTIELG